MFKSLTHAIGVSLFLLFVGGTIIISAYHKTHCDDAPATDSDTHCPICQVANTPCLTPVPIPAIEPAQTVMGAVQLPFPLFESSPLPSPSQARAPPVG